MNKSQITLLLVFALVMGAQVKSNLLAQGLNLGQDTTSSVFRVYEKDTLDFKLRQYFPSAYAQYNLSGAVKASAALGDKTAVGTYYDYETPLSTSDRPAAG
jgi:hypothetical protein